MCHQCGQDFDTAIRNRKAHVRGNAPALGFAAAPLALTMTAPGGKNTNPLGRRR